MVPGVSHSLLGSGMVSQTPQEHCPLLRDGMVPQSQKHHCSLLGNGAMAVPSPHQTRGIFGGWAPSGFKIVCDLIGNDVIMIITIIVYKKYTE